MRDVSFADDPPRAAPTSRRRAADWQRPIPVTAKVRLSMVVCGFIPVLHLTGVLFLFAAPIVGEWGLRAALLGPLVLYLLPPVVARLSMGLFPLRSGRIDVNSGGFVAWWFTAQWQVIFNRFPFLEELLRMVPGLYSLWLRCWGARIGSLVYWSPGVVILDRPLVDVGDRVVFGMGVRVNPHVLTPDEGGDVSLRLGRITVGSDSLIGGYSLLLPGCIVAAGEVTPAMRTVHPFAEFKDGRQVRAATP